MFDAQIHKYANINIKTSNRSIAAKLTETKARLLGVKNEMNFLYKNKFQLNKQLYDLHISNANTWGNVWLAISSNIDNILNDIMKEIYNNLNKKFEKLKKDNNIHVQHSKHIFYQHE
jgi:hypothetical protein